MPLAESKNTVSPTAIRPSSGRLSPASARTTEVLPAPERPNSATTPGTGAENAASTRKSPCRLRIARSSIGAPSASHDPPHPAGENFGENEPGDRERDRDAREARRHWIAARSLDRGVDRERHGLGL